MIKGIIIFESGEVQQVGEITTLSSIITTIRQLLPDLEKKERKRIFDTLSTEEIAELIKGKEVLEP